MQPGVEHSLGALGNALPLSRLVRRPGAATRSGPVAGGWRGGWLALCGALGDDHRLPGVGYCCQALLIVWAPCGKAAAATQIPSRSGDAMDAPPVVEGSSGRKGEAPVDAVTAASAIARRLAECGDDVQQFPDRRVVQA